MVGSSLDELSSDFAFSMDDSEVEDRSASKRRASLSDRYGSSFIPSPYSDGFFIRKTGFVVQVFSSQ